MTLLEI